MPSDSPCNAKRIARRRRITKFSPCGDRFCLGKICGRSMIAPTDHFFDTQKIPRFHEPGDLRLFNDCCTWYSARSHVFYSPAEYNPTCRSPSPGTARSDHTGSARLPIITQRTAVCPRALPGQITRVLLACRIYPNVQQSVPGHCPVRSHVFYSPADHNPTYSSLSPGTARLTWCRRCGRRRRPGRG